MTTKITSSIASWKSAALLALIAMVAAVAFSGVLTNTQNAKAQDPAPGNSVTIVVGGSGTITIPDTGDTGTDATITPLTDAGAGITVAHTADDTADDEGDTDDTVTIYVAETVYPGSYTLTFNANVENLPATEGVNEAQVAVTVVGKTANPGDEVTVVFLSTTTSVPPNQYAIGSDSTASGLFADAPVRPRPVIVCANDNASCDQVTEAVTGPPALDSADVGLRIEIAKDSPEGKIYISASGTAGAAEHIINVVAPQEATGLALGPPGLGISQTAGGDGENITIKVTNNRGEDVEGQEVTVTTTVGQFADAPDAPAADCNGFPVCKVETNDKGEAVVSLQGDGRSGAATVTATAGSLTRTLTVTFFGTPANLSAAAVGDVATVDQGKTHYVIVTVTDKDDNPVKGSKVGASATTELENPTVVDVSTNETYDGGTPGDTPPALQADDIQACSVGTTSAGKCAVMISAAANASRGIHTVSLSTKVGAKTLSDTIDIHVVGKPASIEVEAPESVTPRTRVTVNIEVRDDAGELVGGGNVKVVKLEGRGAVLGTAEGNAALTGGKASFTYYATSTDAAAVFELTAGVGPAAVVEIIEIVVAAPVVEADPEPEAPPATWSVELTAGTHNVVWNGEDGADPSAGAADGVSAIWQWNGSGWDGYFPSAADVPGGNTLESLSNGAAYWVIVE